MFSILCGYTLGEYIRLRRLSKAGEELAGDKEKVIDVALKYGYDSPDSFTKAFQKFHGITPSQARMDGKMLKLFSRLSIKISLEGGSTMNYRIEEKDEMILTGYKRHFSGVPDDRMDQTEDIYVNTRALQYILGGISGNYIKTIDIITNINDDGYDFYIANQSNEYCRNHLEGPNVLGAEFAGYFENITKHKPHF